MVVVVYSYYLGPKGLHSRAPPCRVKVQDLPPTLGLLQNSQIKPTKSDTLVSPYA